MREVNIYNFLRSNMFSPNIEVTEKAMLLNIIDILSSIFIWQKVNGSIEDINDIGGDKKPDEDNPTESTLGSMPPLIISSTPSPNKLSSSEVTSEANSKAREKRQTHRRGQKNPSSSQANSPAKPSNNGFRSTTTPQMEGTLLADDVELTEREEKELQENLTIWLAVMAKKDKNMTLHLGHQFEQMILRCTFKSTNCTHAK